MKEKVNFWETSFFGIFNNPLYCIKIISVIFEDATK